MKTAHIRYILLAFICTGVLALAGACSCADAAEFFLENISVSDVLPSISTYSHEASSSETTVTTVTSGTTVSAADILTHTETTTTSTQETSVTSVSTTTSKKPQTTTAKTNADDSRNAPGVYNPNYKTKYYIVVHIGSQSVAVYGKDEDGYYNRLVKSFTCSTGMQGYGTKTGAYTIWRKFRWRTLSGGVYGQYCSSISKSYLFHSVPYSKQNYSTLRNQEYDKLGSPASHGCIRLCTRDSKWIYDNCAIDTQVYVTKTSGPAGAGVPKRNTDPMYDGWDPSDKWASGNPYFNKVSTTTSEMTSATTTTTATETTTAADATTETSTETTTSATVTQATSAAADNTENDA